MRLFPERLLWPGLGEGAGRRGPLSLPGHAPGWREVDGKVDAERHRAFMERLPAERAGFSSQLCPHRPAGHLSHTSFFSSIKGS